VPSLFGVSFGAGRFVPLSVIDTSNTHSDPDFCGKAAPDSSVGVIVMDRASVSGMDAGTEAVHFDADGSEGFLGASASLDGEDTTGEDGACTTVGVDGVLGTEEVSPPPAFLADPV